MVDILSKRNFNYFFFISALVSLLVVVIRSIVVPINHDEAATFFFYVQSGSYMPFYSHTDANNHVLNSFLANCCFHVFGSSPLSLRLPNVIAFIILIFSTYKISTFLNQISSKVFITAAFLLSFHWLTFYGACRGYGLSMALLILSIYFMLEYLFDSMQYKYFYLTLLAFQLAVSANLILIVVVAVLSFVIFVVQLTNKQFFKLPVIAAWLVYAGLLYYWLSFSYYLQDSGALYYGAGESYWKTTFVTLIQLIFGFSNPLFKWLLVVLFLATVGACIFVNAKIIFKLQIKQQLKRPSYSFLFLIVLSTLCIAFYLMHKLMGVNFPEDRTGLFFYVFYVLLIAFSIDLLCVNYNKGILLVVSLAIIIHFFYALNFRKHSLYTYETIPQRFYDRLIKEQQKTEERITIGGHRVRELFYGYMNYRNAGYLNPADPVELMQMNCDYYLGTKAEEKYYKPYYEVIDTEPDWGFVLLKRKKPIIKKQFVEIKNYVINTTDGEFNDVYHKTDTVFYETKPLQAQVNFTIEKISKPTNTWLVFAINDSLNQTAYFKRYSLQWSGYDLNNKTFDYKINIGNLPPKAKNIAVFFWNIEKQPFTVKVNKLTISQLEGDGVDYEAPDIK